MHTTSQKGASKPIIIFVVAVIVIAAVVYGIIRLKNSVVSHTDDDNYSADVDPDNYFPHGNETAGDTVQTSDSAQTPGVNVANFNDFAKIMYGKFSGRDVIFANLREQLVKPQDINWSAPGEGESSLGQFTLNPETQWNDAHFAKAASDGLIKVVSISGYNGESLQKVGQYVVKTYSKDYLIPGLEFAQWSIDNANKLPSSLKDGTYDFLFGSVFPYDAYGNFGVGYVYQNNPSFEFKGMTMNDNTWRSDYRVVLIKR
jgi:hypothetical protein